MPIGSISNLAPTICDIVTAFAGTMVRLKFADLGMGYGIYGPAIRQWVDSGYAKGGVWGSYILGVEAFEGYRNPAWGAYDYVHTIPIEDWIKRGRRDRYHVILLNDVIEHMTKPQGVGVIGDLKNLLEPNGRLYVTTPGVFFEQDAVYGNQYEMHKSHWELAELESMGFSALSNRSGGKFDGRTIDGLGNQMLSAVFVQPKVRR